MQPVKCLDRIGQVWLQQKHQTLGAHIADIGFLRIMEVRVSDQGVMIWILLRLLLLLSSYHSILLCMHRASE